MADESSALPPRKDATHTTTSAFQYPPADATVGSFELRDAIQETVVTTTTTTRITLPPIITHPPQDLAERDPRQYVLANSLTPDWLRRVQFEHHGKTVTFQESDDPLSTMRRYQDKARKIRQRDGTIRKEVRHENLETPVRGYGHAAVDKAVQNVREGAGQKRTAAPPSIAEAAELASLGRRTKKPRSQLHRMQPDIVAHPSLNSGAFILPSNHSPVTPDAEAGAEGGLQPTAALVNQHARRDASSKVSSHRMRAAPVTQQPTNRNDDIQMADNDSLEDDSQLGPPFYGIHKKQRLQPEPSTVLGASRPGRANSQAPVVDSNDEPAEGSQPRRRPQLRPQPLDTLTSSQLDASLPSPSLSPITAAANAAWRQRNHFDDSFAETIDEDAGVVSGFELEDDSNTHTATSQSQGSMRAPSLPQFKFTAGQQQGPNLLSTAGLTIKDIPTIVDTFDSMPEALQTYVMYQLLRRCAKPTLQMVAGVVNPALKCDPFNVLPPEIGLNITRFLDAQSMCRAAQVSKRWRRLINSDETAWKDLLDRDEYELPRDEIARAVKEGWGWQHPGADGHEEDLSKYVQRNTPELASGDGMQGVVTVSDDDDTASTTTTRSKRRSLTTHARGKKNHKRRPAQPASASKNLAVASWRRTFRSAQGPLGYATAAAQAIPHPAVGLPSLKNMHLFKSLYQRHYLIRKAWMDETSQPQHLAFRAHHRHVVTCLLFDSDKILTGSDDTKICVYDTKTGALRTRLEGHEGGVWALQYDGDTLVSGSTDRSVRVWDIKSGRCMQVFQGHTSTVRCLVILQPVQIGTEPDGRPIMMPEVPLIITGSRDSSLRVWRLPQPGDPKFFQAGPPGNDRENPYFLRTLSGHHNSVRAIAAHGDTLISGSYDCTVRVWKISTGDLVHRLQGHTQKVYSVVLDHVRNRCISGSMDNLVKVWDLQTGAALFNLEGHTSLVGLLDLSNDRLVSAAADSTLRIWDPESGACKATLSAHTGAITCFQHDGQKVISGSDRTLKMWNVKNGDCVRDLLTDLSGVWQVRFDERRCVAAVQRNNFTYIEVLDFGAFRDGVPANQRGRRIFVDCRGRETVEVEAAQPDAADGTA
ncbi:hypothetical protein BAUCODRAFT_67017 [Baudoinia panamericana UAMH 10762]|uniref:F-box domain-containing protein n=1 Tax=Baudoinia panamericana (strain UAMH 10762) TaxID=717646 RepID=M2NFP3_BAUPA|nr:uncharacterized protein BAUCODRAFT_67017 [Baudoinia panamericana UAMH 10762]EMC97825.1 hypothetical protein BAUCODRAFT_67017 [Baudoinia panamericana UAMH 10762]